MNIGLRPDKFTLGLFCLSGKNQDVTEIIETEKKTVILKPCGMYGKKSTNHRYFWQTIRYFWQTIKKGQICLIWPLKRQNGNHVSRSKSSWLEFFE